MFKIDAQQWKFAEYKAKEREKKLNENDDKEKNIDFNINFKIDKKKFSILNHSFLVGKNLNGEKLIIALGNKKSILGLGKYGVVKIGQTKENKNFAIKIIKFKPKEKKFIDKEIKILRRLKRLIGVIKIIYKLTYNSCTYKIYLVKKYYPGINLSQQIQESFPENTEKSIKNFINKILKIFKSKKRENFLKLIFAYKLVSCVIRLHKNNIIHLDIKPHNFIIRISDNHIKVTIIDFGFAEYIRSRKKGLLMVKRYIVKGTPNYMSPDILNACLKLKGTCVYSESSDVFSLGVLLYTNLGIKLQIVKKMRHQKKYKKVKLKNVKKLLKEKLLNKYPLEAIIYKIISIYKCVLYSLQNNNIKNVIILLDIHDEIKDKYDISLTNSELLRLREITKNKKVIKVINQKLNFDFSIEPKEKTFLKLFKLIKEKRHNRIKPVNKVNNKSGSIMPKSPSKFFRPAVYNFIE